MIHSRIHSRSSSALRQLVVGGLASITLLLTSACQSSVKIELPAKGDSAAPVTTFRVRFHNDVDPATFRATLNGQDITQRFQPAPVPGNVSTASSDFMSHTTNNRQVLEVHALFKKPPAGIPTRATGDLVEFSPPRVFVFLGNSTGHDLTLKEAQTITATATVLDVPREGLTVVLTTDENSAVSLNNANAGTPITVTIPANDRRVAFTVRGIEAGKTFIVRPLARGYVSELGGGTVLRAN